MVWAGISTYALQMPRHAAKIAVTMINVLCEGSATQVRTGSAATIRSSIAAVHNTISELFIERKWKTNR